MSGRKFQRFLAYFWQHKRLTIILLVLVLLVAASIAIFLHFSALWSWFYSLLSALWSWFYNLLSTPLNPNVNSNLTLLMTIIGVLIAFYSALSSAAPWQKSKPQSPSPTPTPSTPQPQPTISPSPTPAGSPGSPPVPQPGATISTPIPGTTNTISASAPNPIVAQIAPVQAALTLSATPLPINPAPNGMIAPPVTEQPPTLPATPTSISTEGQTDHQLVFSPITALTDKKAFYGRKLELERIKKSIAIKESIPIQGIRLGGKTWLISL